MKGSDGLTARGEHVYFVTKTPEELKNESLRADRLVAYENTGLSPEEVEKLKDNVFPADKVEHLISEMETIIRAIEVIASWLLMKIKVLEAEGKNGIQER